MAERFNPVDPLGLFGRQAYLTRLTDRELVWQLLLGGVKPEELPDNYRNRLALKEYRVMAAELADPILYCDTVIRNLEERLKEAKASREKREQPTWVRGSVLDGRRAS